MKKKMYRINENDDWSLMNLACLPKYLSSRGKIFKNYVSMKKTRKLIFENILKLLQSKI